MNKGKIKHWKWRVRFLPTFRLLLWIPYPGCHTGNGSRHFLTYCRMNHGQNGHRDVVRAPLTCSVCHSQLENILAFLNVRQFQCSWLWYLIKETQRKNPYWYKGSVHKLLGIRSSFLYNVSYRLNTSLKPSQPTQAHVPTCNVLTSFLHPFVKINSLMYCFSRYTQLPGAVDLS